MLFWVVTEYHSPSAQRPERITGLRFSPRQVDLCAALFVTVGSGVLLISPPGAGKSHICLSLAWASIHAGHTVPCRSASDLAEDLSKPASTGTSKQLVHTLTRTALLVIEDLGMRNLPATAAEDLPEILARRYRGGCHGDQFQPAHWRLGRPARHTAAAAAMLARFLHRAELVLFNRKRYRMFDRQQRLRSLASLTDTTV